MAPSVATMRAERAPIEPMLSGDFDVGIADLPLVTGEAGARVLPVEGFAVNDPRLFPELPDGLAAQASLPAQASTRAQPAAQSLPQAGQYLRFELGDESYAIEVLKVQELRAYTEPTRIANAPAYLRGLIDLRGRVVPVIDLRLRLGLPETQYDMLTAVMMVPLGDTVFGVVVDAVTEVLDIEAGQISRVPQFGGGDGCDLVTGIATIADDAGRRVPLLLADFRRLLAR